MTALIPAPVYKSYPFRDLTMQFGEPVVWLRSEIDRLDDSEKSIRSVFSFGSRLALVPALEPVNDETSYRLTPKLPGLAERDCEINVGDGMLIASGEEERKISLPAERASLRSLPAPNRAPPRNRSQRQQGQFRERRAYRHHDSA